MNTLLIPLNQGLFLNNGWPTRCAARCGLNPFESGSVFKPVGCWIFFSYQFSAKQFSNFFLVAKAVSFFHPCRIFYLLPTRLCYASCRRRQCAMSCPTVFLLLSLRGLQAGVQVWLDRVALVSGQVGLNLKDIGCVHTDGSDGGDGSQDTDLFFRS